MEQGNEKKPFEEPDTGLIRTPGNPFQRVVRMEPPQSETDSWTTSDDQETIPLIFDEEYGTDVAVRHSELELSEPD